jgi:hypothetical protein
LSALAIPVVILIGAQIDTTSGPSIGGGGYDLGPFLYSWLLVIVTQGILRRDWRISATRRSAHKRHDAVAPQAVIARPA